MNIIYQTWQMNWEGINCPYCGKEIAIDHRNPCIHLKVVYTNPGAYFYYLAKNQRESTFEKFDALLDEISPEEEWRILSFQKYAIKCFKKCYSRTIDSVVFLTFPKIIGRIYEYKIYAFKE